MPCYNSEKFVTAAVKSVQAQTFSDWELLIEMMVPTTTARQSLAKFDDRIIVLEIVDLWAQLVPEIPLFQKLMAGT